jgi:hypothetical protein
MLAYYSAMKQEDQRRMARQLPAQDVPWVVNQVCRQVLGRGVLDQAGAIIDPASLMTYGCGLLRGDMSVRDLVRALGTSPEFAGKMCDSMPFHEALSGSFERILGRPIDQSAMDHYTNCYENQGWSMQDIILDLVNSQEYTDVFGEDQAPSRRVHSH